MFCSADLAFVFFLTLQPFVGRNLVKQFFFYIGLLVAIDFQFILRTFFASRFTSSISVLVFLSFVFSVVNKIVANLLKQLFFFGFSFVNCYKHLFAFNSAFK